MAALSLEGIGTFISVTGLAATFAADPVIMLMAVILDFCKIIAVSVLAKKWSYLNTAVKGYLIAAVLVLAVITSSGIAGYLSNSFQKAMLPNQGNQIVLDNVLKEQTTLENRKTEIDKQIDQLPSNLVAGRQRLIKTFKPEEDKINARLSEIDLQLPKLQTQQVQLHTAVGPVMFLSQALGITPDEAVSVVIALIIFVFDPLSIAFLITGNRLMVYREEESKPEEDNIKTYIFDGPGKGKGSRVTELPGQEPVQNFELHDFTYKQNPIDIETHKTSESSEVLSEPEISRIEEIEPEYNTEDEARKSFEQLNELIKTSRVDSEEPLVDLGPWPWPVSKDPVPGKSIDLPDWEPVRIPNEVLNTLEVQKPIVPELTQTTKEHLDEVLRQILTVNPEGNLTDEERIRLDLALDRIFGARDHQEPPSEPVQEDEEEYVPDENEAAVVTPSASLLDPISLDNMNGSGFTFLGPHWINPKLLEEYVDKK